MWIVSSHHPSSELYPCILNPMIIFVQNSVHVGARRIRCKMGCLVSVGCNLTFGLGRRSLFYTLTVKKAPCRSVCDSRLYFCINLCCGFSFRFGFSFRLYFLDSLPGRRHPCFSSLSILVRSLFSRCLSRFLVDGLSRLLLVASTHGLRYGHYCKSLCHSCGYCCAQPRTVIQVPNLVVTSPSVLNKRSKLTVGVVRQLRSLWPRGHRSDHPFRSPI
jgi:hypothetical protein